MNTYTERPGTRSAEAATVALTEEACRLDCCQHPDRRRYDCIPAIHCHL